MVKQYVIERYIENKDGNPVEKEIYLVYETEMFQWIDRAKRENLKIVVSAVSDCLLDWS